ncbi:hypothetical protein SAMN04488005_0778 [Yoonia tamlensis]|uniref:Uncharacterized protein n=1 Tax=Yoonia tamlensis TaxID=390270 RepID=A0A1I6FZ85_9RHOB|nr:DUF6000 family protein [Yoonia tamlensis]SFR35206.1 hypothetical protein SAMN04488005_0778 [Yoonia tamlensis]
MNDATKKQVELHVAGATVRHQSPFENMTTYRNDKECDLALIKKWVVPLYLTGLRVNDKTLATYNDLFPQLSHDILLTMLGEFNWRPRKVGAIFAAISKNQDVENIIGTHLLKSEVCYAGQGYCLALASFESVSARTFLIQYLDYYLQRTDLDFDQGSALGALAYLDPILGSDILSELIPAYYLWQQHRPHRSAAENVINNFGQQMASIATIRGAVGL